MRNYVLVLAMLTVFVAFAGCKKTSDPKKSSKSTAELLIGEWDITHEANDDNNDETMQESEVFIRNHDQQRIFEENGHAAMVWYQSGAAHTTSYNYTLSGNDMTLTPSGGGYTLKVLIVEITEAKLTLRFNEAQAGTPDYVWRMYERKE